MENKSNEIPLVVTSEKGKAQTINTVGSFWYYGVVGVTCGEANNPTTFYEF